MTAAGRPRRPRWASLRGPSLARLAAAAALVLATSLDPSRALLEADFAGDWKQSERVVRTLFGKVRGRVVLPQGRFHDIALQPVEVFLGIPYASPPVGSLRFLPPMTPAHWDGIRDADHWGPSCPQPPPETPPHWSRQRPYFSKDEDRDRTSANRSWTPWPQMADFLQDNQNEDCLYLNIFAPASVGRTEHGKLPVLALTAGSSLEWGGAALLDVTALAAAAHAIVVTFNFRLGALGFFPAMEEASQANNALLDQVAALHWVQRNIDSFGGDHTRVTLLGHGRVASLVHFLAMCPLAKDLFRSVVLLSGSALSPWSLCQPSNAQRFAAQLALALACPTRPSAMVECLRHKSADELVEMSRFPNEVPDHLCGPFGPLVDNSVISAGGIRAAMSKAPFSDHNLLLGVTTKDAISLFSAEERRDGIEPALKERLIRTLVRNTYDYHQQEIFLTIANEYTDWSRSIPSRHDTLAEAAAAIADGTVVAPVVETGVLHAQAAQSSRSRATTHLLVFGSPGETGCASRPSGSPRSGSACTSVGSNVLPRDLLYLLGLPLRTSQSVLYPEFSRQEAKISQALIHYIRNFLRDGNPNGSSRGNGVPYYQGRSKDKQEPVVWPQFEPIHRMHLVLADGVARPDSHWNAHRLSIWNRLVPALHRPSRASGAGGGAGGAVVAQPGGAGGLAQASLSPLQLQVQLQRQQHQLLDDAANPATFAGSVRNLSFLLLPNGGGSGGGLLTPADVTPVGQQQRASQTDSGRLSSDASSPSSSSSSPGGANTLSGAQINDNSRKKTALSGGSQGDSDLVTPGSGPSSTTLNGGAISPLNALAALTTGPYSRPLLTVLTVGCSLLVVNLLVFVGTFCQHRERRASVAVATSGVASGSAAVASGNTRTTKSHSKNDDRGCATVKVADAEEALGGHNSLLLQRQQQQQQSEHTTSSKTLTIQDEDVCLQKTMLQKDAAMLFLQETTGNNSPSTLPHVSEPIGGEQRSEEDMFTEVANSSSAILGPLELEACFLYQMAPNFVTSTLPHGHRGSISGRSIVLDGGAGGRKLTTTAATATAATTSESDPATLMSPATCPLPNVVPIGALGQTAGAHQSSQVTAATLLPQPDVAVTSAMSQSVTATMTFARHSSTHQYETHQQPTLKEPSRSAFKGGEETTV